MSPFNICFPRPPASAPLFHGFNSIFTIHPSIFRPPFHKRALNRHLLLSKQLISLYIFGQRRESVLSLIYERFIFARLYFIFMSLHLLVTQLMLLYAHNNNYLHSSAFICGLFLTGAHPIIQLFKESFVLYPLSNRVH